MKNLFFISMIALIFSCSKKDDPQPSSKFAGEKKVYYHFNALAGSTDGIYFNGKIEVNGKKNLTVTSPTYKYKASTSTVEYYMPVVGLDTSMIIQNVSTFKFTLAWGKTPTSLKPEGGQVSNSLFLIENDTSWVISSGTGRQML